METRDGIAVRAKRHLLARHAAVVQRRAERLDPAMRALLWSATSGLLFVVLNSLMRGLSMALDGFETQFLRYLMGLAVMLPFMARSGFRAYIPHNLVGQFTRGGVHTIGLLIWFVALPRISLADTTAIGFTTPIFIMLGAVMVFKEPMRWERWLAAAIGFAGVLIVVGPKLSGTAGVYNLVMLASSPVYAASYLMTKALTRYERAIRTLMDWKINVDEAMFLGGLQKGEFLREFEPDFFFDDQTRHVAHAAMHVPSGHVAAGIANVLN